ncbi:peptidoglycan recognition protein family protein [Ekhidna sp.]|uniref:peptidoglycan recognition protein family protein n=1 Tax=Ekhidna sp. TaxID=2608089 RepID=UPI003CCBB219
MAEIQNMISILPWHPTRRWGVRQLSAINKIIIHQELGEADVEAVNNYHIKPNHISSKGCPHLCYHFSIRKNGEIIQANELSSVTWHCKGQNIEAVGIMAVGNFNGPGYDMGTSEPTKEQIKSIDFLIDYLIKSLRLTNQDVFGHYHFGKPACPGHELQKYVEKRRESLVAVDSNVEKSVKEVQKRLNQLGFAAGAEDGIHGIKTLAAIRKFQAAQGLHVDGIVGPKTWSRLLELTK